jgi:hypothetical protein
VQKIWLKQSRKTARLNLDYGGILKKISCAAQGGDIGAIEKISAGEWHKAAI